MKSVFEKAIGLAKNLPGKIGVYIKDLTTGEQASFQPDVPVVAASVIKIPVMIEAFRQKEAGQLDFTREIEIRHEDKLPSCGALTYLHDGIHVQIQDLVTLMIILSDNTATNLLIDILGQDEINRTIQDLKLKGTVLRRKLFMEELNRLGIQNSITAGDMGFVLEELYNGHIISKSASRDMLNILFNQRLNGKIPFFLHDRDIRCAHKTGEDDGITHDVGIICGSHPIVFCFVSEQTDVPSAERTMQDMARLVTFSEQM